MTAPSTVQARTGYWLPALALLAVPAAADASSNAVVIDFDQSRLILGWIGLWLVAVFTFAFCADKRIQPMTRLARYLERRARRRASQHADDTIRALAQDDPRILADLVAATDRASETMPWDAESKTSCEQAPAATTPGHPLAARGLQTTPLPVSPRNLQYRPG